MNGNIEKLTICIVMGIALIGMLCVASYILGDRTPDRISGTSAFSIGPDGTFEETIGPEQYGIGIIFDMTVNEQTDDAYHSSLSIALDIGQGYLLKKAAFTCKGSQSMNGEGIISYGSVQEVLMKLSGGTECEIDGKVITFGTGFVSEFQNKSRPGNTDSIGQIFDLLMYDDECPIVIDVYLASHDSDVPSIHYQFDIRLFAHPIAYRSRRSPLETWR